ncbi:MAG: RimK family alpha-L-glutamate ligase [Dysgonomonas sp.]
MKNKGWILYPKSVLSNTTNAFEWLLQEAKKFDIDLDILFFEDLQIVSGRSNLILYKNREVRLPAFVVVRGYESLLSSHFELLGIPVINSSASMALSLNKMKTHQILSSNNINTPETVYSPLADYTYQSLSEYFKEDRFIVKGLEGSRGIDVFLIENEHELKNAIRACGNYCIAQRFVNASYGKDVRAWVVGDNVVAGVLRYSEKSFKSNFSQGGKVKLYNLTDREKDLAVQSVKLLGLEFAGIDLLFTEDGDLSVCEINGNAGFRSIASISESNIPYKLFEYIRNAYL